VVWGKAEMHITANAKTKNGAGGRNAGPSLWKYPFCSPSLFPPSRLIDHLLFYLDL
jgi:hypothetical protein